MTIEQSSKVSQALEVMNVIAQGKTNPRLQSHAMLKALLASADAPKVKHLAEVYETEKPLF